MTMLFLCGEVVPTRLAKSWSARLPGVKLLNVYSTWESLDISMSDISARAAAAAKGGPSSAAASYVSSRNSPIGTVLPNVRTYIVDSSGQLVPRGVIGELWISGPQMAVRYSDPLKTAEKFRDNPFVDVDGHHADHPSAISTEAAKAALGSSSSSIESEEEEEKKKKRQSKYSRVYTTGDLAVVLPSGEMEIKGRSDSSTVKIRAFKVSLPSIEAAIMDLADVTGVTSAVVVPQLDPATGAYYCLPSTVCPQLFALNPQPRILLPTLQASPTLLRRTLSSQATSQTRRPAS
jgi:acyl-CoA synthetase (AMP-forming)/AMP-acid ligase II